jgi:hypothetical protein
MKSTTPNNFASFFQSEDINKIIKQTIHEVGLIIYNEMYIYVWFICLYHVFLIFIVLANLFILLKLIMEKGEPKY